MPNGTGWSRCCSPSRGRPGHRGTGAVLRRDLEARSDRLAMVGRPPAIRVLGDGICGLPVLADRQDQDPHLGETAGQGGCRRHHRMGGLHRFHRLPGLPLRRRGSRKGLTIRVGRVRTAWRRSRRPCAWPYTWRPDHQDSPRSCRLLRRLRGGGRRLDRGLARGLPKSPTGPPPKPAARASPPVRRLLWPAGPWTTSDSIAWNPCTPSATRHPAAWRPRRASPWRAPSAAPRSTRTAGTTCTRTPARRATDRTGRPSRHHLPRPAVRLRHRRAVQDLGAAFPQQVGEHHQNHGGRADEEGVRPRHCPRPDAAGAAHLSGAVEADHHVRGRERADQQRAQQA